MKYTKRQKYIDKNFYLIYTKQKDKFIKNKTIYKNFL